MRLVSLKVLSEGDIGAIHGATLDILEHCGVEVNSAAMLALLAERGATIDASRRVARFPRAMVEDAVAKAPGRIEVYDREGHPAFVLGEGPPKVASGHNAVFWVDSETGVTRPSTVGDIEQFARLCEELVAIDMIGIPVMPQDIPNPEHSLLYGVKACIENSRKPIFFSTDRASINGGVIDLLRAAFQGDMRKKAYGISQLSPTSPLYWEGNVVEALVQTVAEGVPLAILPEPNAGVSAPYTLAGLLTVNNAECLSGVVMTQLLRPGAPVMYANSWTTTDMRRGYALVGSCETTICRIAGAQLGRFYGLPTHTTAPNSDNHAHDEQNAWEKALSLFCAVGAGNDLIVNCGMFATGMTCSHEQLIMDEEMTAISQRIARGIEVSEDTIAAAVIHEIGPHGSGYLTAVHTLEHLQSDEYIEPRVSVRGPKALWDAAGAKDSCALARERAAELAQRSPRATLDAERRGALNDILALFEQEAQ